MNGKIALAVLVSFGVVFFSLFALENAFSDQDKKSHPFFLLESPQKKIFLLGSSHVGV